MRWLPRWPFRGEAEPAATATASRDEADAGPADAAVPGRAEAAWADLPPLVATVVAPPLTAPAREFAAGLAGSHAPEPILRPLGHDVSADGPGGLVAGLATPIVDTHPRAREGEGLPRPGRPAGRGRHAAAARAGHGGVAGPLPVVPEGPSTTAPALSQPPAAPGRGPLAPVSQDASEPRRLLTAVRPETLALALDPMATTSAPSSVAAGYDAGATGRVAATRGITSPAPAPTGPAAGEAGTAEPRPGAASGPTRSPGTVSVRRSGLGAPLAGPPPTVMRAPGARLAPVAPPAGTGRPIPAERPSLPHAPRSVVSGGAVLPPATLHERQPHREPIAEPLAAEASPRHATEADPGEEPSASGRPRALTAPTPRPVRPVLGAGVPLAIPAAAPGGRGRPAGSGAVATAAPQVQRSAAAWPATDLVETSTTGATGRGAGSEPLPAVTPSPAGPLARLGPFPVRVGPADAPTPWTASGPDARPPAPPSGRTPAGRRATSSTRAGIAVQRLGAPTAARIPQAAPFAPGPFGPTRAFAGPAVAGPTLDGPALAGPPTAAPHPAGPAIQRAVEAEDVSADVAGGAGASAGSGARGGDGGGSGLAAASDGDLDLLARRLYGRIRDRLRGELLLDRERSGSLADF